METNNNPNLADLAAMLANQLQRDAKVLRCYQCGWVLPNGYDDVEAHSPRCQRLITMDMPDDHEAYYNERAEERP